MHQNIIIKKIMYVLLNTNIITYCTYLQQLQAELKSPKTQQEITAIKV
jgi:hypothetical protein